MDGIPMVRAAAYWPIVPAMDGIGIPVQQHMAAAHIPDEVMSSPELLLPERTAWELFDRVREREGIDDIGFRVGASHGVLDVPGLAQPLSGNASLLQLMKAFCDQLKGHSNFWNYWISRVPDGVLLNRRGSPIDVGRWPIEQYAIAYLTDLVRMSAPKEWAPSRIWLQVNESEVREEVAWLGDAEVFYDQANTAIHVPFELLALPVRYIEPYRAPLPISPIELSFIANVKQVIRVFIHEPGFGLDELAHLTGMHPRTLQRHLSIDHGTTFRKLLGETRFELAREMLRDCDAQISDISYQLGYTSLSAFSKEFRKWAGVAPGVYRSYLD